MQIEWVKIDSETESWTPKPGVNVLVTFDEDLFCYDTRTPREEQSCYQWRLRILSQGGKELFLEESGEYDYYSRHHWPLAECKQDAVSYYNNRLKDAVSEYLARAREEEQNLSEAMQILEGVTVF